jgi:hypothetical protein
MVNYVSFIFLAVLAVIATSTGWKTNKPTTAALAAQGILVLVGVFEVWQQWGA